MKYLSYNHIFVLVGSDISIQSGILPIPDRAAFLKSISIDQVFSRAGYTVNPQLVLDFHNDVKKEYLRADPNAAHKAIAYIQQELEGSPVKVTIMSLTLDTLLEKAGAKNVLHLKGRIDEAQCNACNQISRVDADLTALTTCSHCGVAGQMRPGAVWLDEEFLHQEAVEAALNDCDLFAVVGMPEKAFPPLAMNMLQEAISAGAYTIEIAQVASPHAKLFDDWFYGPLDQMVPLWRDKLVFR